ncbi:MULTISPECIES: DUF1108 family protein [Staphylococcus]|uniref:DUF1108 family protein n=1 Tax=Staphylococcus agnetis TaxID=985762 RepID=A0AAW9YS26_9STAP|nr:MULTISPECIES: DUF1108 family protein [Staphylococcus]KFE40769.1 hypothetical protein SAGN_11352 [Staphylococcus agnetis]MCO4357283.1 DUF1108 family protein [Staphylococcus agnetis]MCO4363266.1 DUF1108 family protein [Staphylococcus agnetis]NHM92938.1 DUF1108 family protein [Staphylococcus sp. 10602379]NJI02267.1 DUF1108 family protein [Staphylococcus agnetis]
MYYEIGQEFSKTITIDGFKFYMYVAKTEFGVDVTIQDRDNTTVSEITINDVSGMESATDILIYEARMWIAENVDEYDHVMNGLLGGFR